MSKLYGYLTGDSGQATKASTRHISGAVQTEAGRITVELSANGAYEVHYVPLNGRTPCAVSITIARGTLAELEAQRKEAEADAARRYQAPHSPDAPYIAEVYSGYTNSRLVARSEPFETEAEAQDWASRKWHELTHIDGGLVFQPGEYLTYIKRA